MGLSSTTPTRPTRRLVQHTVKVIDETGELITYRQNLSDKAAARLVSEYLGVNIVHVSPPLPDSKSVLKR